MFHFICLYYQHFYLSVFSGSVTCLRWQIRVPLHHPVLPALLPVSVQWLSHLFKMADSCSTSSACTTSTSTCQCVFSGSVTCLRWQIHVPLHQPILTALLPVSVQWLSHMFKMADSCSTSSAHTNSTSTCQCMFSGCHLFKMVDSCSTSSACTTSTSTCQCMFSGSVTCLRWQIHVPLHQPVLTTNSTSTCQCSVAQSLV